MARPKEFEPLPRDSQSKILIGLHGYALPATNPERQLAVTMPGGHRGIGLILRSISHPSKLLVFWSSRGDKPLSNQKDVAIGQRTSEVCKLNDHVLGRLE